MNVLYLLLGFFFGVLIRCRFTRTYREKTNVKVNFYVNGRKLNDREEIKNLQKFLNRNNNEETIH